MDSKTPQQDLSGFISRLEAAEKAIRELQTISLPTRRSVIETTLSRIYSHARYCHLSEQEKSDFDAARPTFHKNRTKPVSAPSTWDAETTKLFKEVFANVTEEQDQESFSQYDDLLFSRNQDQHEVDAALLHTIVEMGPKEPFITSSMIQLIKNQWHQLFQVPYGEKSSEVITDDMIAWNRWDRHHKSSSEGTGGPSEKPDTNTQTQNDTIDNSMLKDDPASTILTMNPDISVTGNATDGENDTTDGSNADPKKHNLTKAEKHHIDKQIKQGEELHEARSKASALEVQASALEGQLQQTRLSASVTSTKLQEAQLQAVKMQDRIVLVNTRQFRAAHRQMLPRTVKILRGANGWSKVPCVGSDP